MPEPKSPFKRVRRNFDRNALKRVCEMREREFADAYRMEVVEVPSFMDDDDDFYLFRDNGADILAVAHLDTVMPHDRRMANFIDTAAGPVVYSGALDDRLGAYTILELLPKLGVRTDLLLTVGEESGNSTAQHFASTKDYLWMIEFDRGGTDVVMYQYEDDECVDLVEESGARVGSGSFSDIAFLGHLEVKGFNWGVGYRDYHGPRSHAYLEDYWMMVGHFLKFHEANSGMYLPHDNRPSFYGRGEYGGGSTAWLEDAAGWWSRAAAGKDPDGWDEVAFEDLESEDFGAVNQHLLAIEDGH